MKTDSTNNNNPLSKERHTSHKLQKNLEQRTPPSMKGVGGCFKRKPNLVYISRRLPYNPKLKQRARDLRKNQTSVEKKLWCESLSFHKESFARQKIIDNYIVDFYCAKYKLVLEIDGDSHFQEGAERCDDIRNSILRNYGLHILRFTNEEVYESFSFVCEEIECFINTL